MNEARKAVWRRLLERVFPKTPDFFALLHDQCELVHATVSDFVLFMETDDQDIGNRIRRAKNEADELKVRNLHALNEAFSTPIDREDLYRAITDLDHIVDYFKTTVSEMDVLNVEPDHFMKEMARQIREGTEALVNGFETLGNDPVAATDDADAGRRAERRVEHIYREALAQLFEGDDFRNMFKRREIYRHLSNAADRLAHASNTLHDIIVKIS